MAIDPVSLPAPSANTTSTTIRQDTHTTAQTDSPAGALIGTVLSDLSKPLPPQVWNLIYLGAAAVLLLIGYLVVESISYGNHTAQGYLSGPLPWIGGLLVAIVTPSPITRR